MARTFLAVLPAVLLAMACSGAAAQAPAEITGTRAHPDGGMEFDLRVENPLDGVAEAECSVEAPDGQGVNIVTAVPATGEKTLTTRMQDLPEDTSAEEFDVSCTVET